MGEQVEQGEQGELGERSREQEGGRGKMEGRLGREQTREGGEGWTNACVEHRKPLPSYDPPPPSPMDGGERGGGDRARGLPFFLAIQG